MSRSFQQMIDSEAFEKRKEKTAGAIAAGYTADKRGKRRRRESEEGEGYEDAMRRISLLLTNSNKQRTSLHVKNAKK